VSIFAAVGLLFFWRRSALHMEVLWEGSFEITRDLKTDKKGIPKHRLRMMALANEAKRLLLQRGT
jgi:hypothetical protein